MESFNKLENLFNNTILPTLETGGKFSCGCKMIDSESFTACSTHMDNIDNREDCIIYYYYNENDRVPITIHGSDQPHDISSLKKWG